jgi:hypothetical protein
VLATVWSETVVVPASVVVTVVAAEPVGASVGVTAVVFQAYGQRAPEKAISLDPE